METESNQPSKSNYQFTKITLKWPHEDTTCYILNWGDSIGQMTSFLKKKKKKGEGGETNRLKEAKETNIANLIYIPCFDTNWNKSIVKSYFWGNGEEIEHELGIKWY